MLSVNKGNRDLLSVVSLKYSMLVFHPEGRLGKTHIRAEPLKGKWGIPRTAPFGWEDEGINNILNVFMFIKAGSVFNSMDTSESSIKIVLNNRIF